MLVIAFIVGVKGGGGEDIRKCVNHEVQMQDWKKGPPTLPSPVFLDLHFVLVSYTLRS